MLLPSLRRGCSRVTRRGADCQPQAVLYDETASGLETYDRELGGHFVSDTLRVGPLELEVLRRGSGRPILLVHGSNPVSPHARFLDLLAAHGEVVAPSHPGFGNSPLPEDFDTMYDLVHLYRDVLDVLPEKVAMIGFSFGGWIAAELAVGGHPKLDRLVLVDPVGVKLGGREERDIAHFFNTDPAELARRAWHDPAKRPDGVYGLGWQAEIDDMMRDEDMVALARNWDSLCLYAWRPHMYNPQLKGWLRRIALPTLVLWGARDRIVTPDYGRAYAGLIPGARFELIETAGHHPELEQPRAFVDAVVRFLQEPSLRGA
jgi:pimeloyl-ACP methyl ester carboxylesterase